MSLTIGGSHSNGSFDRSGYPVISPDADYLLLHSNFARWHMAYWGFGDFRDRVTLSWPHWRRLASEVESGRDYSVNSVDDPHRLACIRRE